MAAGNVNKVDINGETIIDLTADTVDAEHLAEGYTAHDKSGAAIVGKMTSEGGASSGPRLTAIGWASDADADVAAYLGEDEGYAIDFEVHYRGTLAQPTGDSPNDSIMFGNVMINTFCNGTTFRTFTVPVTLFFDGETGADTLVVSDDLQAVNVLFRQTWNEETVNSETYRVTLEFYNPDDAVNVEFVSANFAIYNIPKKE